jgi:hypothetical protein
MQQIETAVPPPGAPTESGQDNANRQELQEAAKRCFDRVVEIHKARLTVDLFLALTTVTLTGYAFQHRRTELLFLAAVVPLFCMFVDLLLKYSYATPFLYRAFVADYQIAGDDSEVLLFLQFPGHSPSPYVFVLKLPSEADRRRRFRSLYVRRSLVGRVMVFGGSSVVLVALGFVLRW